MFKELLVKLMNEKKCSGADITRATGISSGLLGDYKRGRSKPSGENMKKLADFFGVSVDYLLGNENALPDTSEGHGVVDLYTVKLSPDEYDLLMRYRNTDSEGQTMIRAAAIQETRASVKKAL